MSMNLYRVTPLPEAELLIVAPTTTKAAEIFVANTALPAGSERKLVIEQFETLVAGEWRANLDDLLACGVIGIARYEEGKGWSFDPPG
jgi:hypothetical protein